MDTQNILAQKQMFQMFIEYSSTKFLVNLNIMNQLIENEKKINLEYCIAYAGSYSIENNKLYGTFNAHCQMPSTQAYGIWEWEWNKNHHFEFWMINNRKNAMVMSEGIGYLLWFDQNQLNLFRSNGVTGTIIASANLAIPTGKNLLMKVAREKNGQFLVWVDEALEIDFIDNVYQNSLYMGLYNWDTSGGYVTNLKLTELI